MAFDLKVTYRKKWYMCARVSKQHKAVPICIDAAQTD